MRLFSTLFFLIIIGFLFQNCAQDLDLSESSTQSSTQNTDPNNPNPDRDYSLFSLTETPETFSHLQTSKDIAGSCTDFIGESTSLKFTFEKDSCQNGETCKVGWTLNQSCRENDHSFSVKSSDSNYYAKVAQLNLEKNEIIKLSVDATVYDSNQNSLHEKTLTKNITYIGDEVEVDVPLPSSLKFIIGEHMGFGSHFKQSTAVLWFHNNNLKDRLSPFYFKSKATAQDSGDYKLQLPFSNTVQTTTVTTHTMPNSITLNGFIGQAIKPSNGNGFVQIGGWGCIEGYDSTPRFEVFIGQRRSASNTTPTYSGYINQKSEIAVNNECSNNNRYLRFKLLIPSAEAAQHKGQRYYGYIYALEKPTQVFTLRFVSTTNNIIP